MTEPTNPMDNVSRRTVLKASAATTGVLAGVQPVSAEPLDGKGNDVCPCAFTIDKAVLIGDEIIEATGLCAVAKPPEGVTVHLQVRGTRGARAIGNATFECNAREGEGNKDTFLVSAIIRGNNRFERGDEIEIHARAHINPDDKPAIGAGKWSWSGTLE